jgi:hypothetical protein
MDSRQVFETYRRMFAATEDGEVCWWYSGWTFVSVDGYPDIPLSQVAAIMTYRTETLSGGRFRVHWREIGCFRDPATGELPLAWTNPITGIVLEPPRTFHEGPGSYTVSPADGTVALELDQPLARLISLQVDFHADAERCWFLQTERKVRGYPMPDGTLPQPVTPSGFEGRTELGFFASRSDIEAGGFVRAHGVYSFRTSGIPTWMGFGALQGTTTTRGTITKALPGEPLDRTSRGRLERLFPGQMHPQRTP